MPQEEAFELGCAFLTQKGILIHGDAEGREGGREDRRALYRGGGRGVHRPGGQVEGAAREPASARTGALPSEAGPAQDANWAGTKLLLEQQGTEWFGNTK